MGSPLSDIGIPENSGQGKLIIKVLIAPALVVFLDFNDVIKNSRWIPPSFAEGRKAGPP
jgi:hypothetical protein